MKVILMKISFPAKLLPLGLCFGILAACTTITPEQQQANDEASCAGYGFKPRSEAYANCLLQLHLDRRADIRAWQNERTDLLSQPVIYQPIIVRR